MRKRVYPIRKSRRSWRIPIYSTHTCDLCIAEQPCPMDDTISTSSVTIDNWDTGTMQTNTGLLYDPNQVVIDDDSFFVDVSTPLNIAASITIFHPEPVTTSALLSLIRDVYRRVYDIEARTSTVRSYLLELDCTVCNNESPALLPVEDSDDLCPICYSEYSSNTPGGKLGCGHDFHVECIVRWLGTNQTCPMCRSATLSCSSCDNVGTHEIHADLAEFPRVYNGMVGRNTTDGMFGIFRYFRDQLVLHDMYYNRETKRLKLRVRGVHTQQV